MKKIFSICLLLALLTNHSNSFANRKEGPGIIDGTLGPYEDKVYSINLVGDSKTYFIGSGDGGQIDYWLYDPNGKLVAYDLKLRSNCDITYYARIPGTYYLLVKNYSKEKASYEVRTN
jgi:hypothetical protein